jgi:hypothetical protein
MHPQIFRCNRFPEGFQRVNEQMQGAIVSPGVVGQGSIACALRHLLAIVDRRDRMTIPPKEKYHPETKARPGAFSPADYPWNNGSILIW